MVKLSILETHCAAADDTRNEELTDAARHAVFASLKRDVERLPLLRSGPQIVALCDMTNCCPVRYDMRAYGRAHVDPSSAEALDNDWERNGMVWLANRPIEQVGAIIEKLEELHGIQMACRRTPGGGIMDTLA